MDHQWLSEHSVYRETDILLLVGGQVFPAHRSVLVDNSGYFKSILGSNAHSSLTPNVMPLSLSGISSHAFTALLDFMYTGRLTVTMNNIYEVLFCAQFLHIPHAIDVCQVFLMQEQQRRVHFSCSPNTAAVHSSTLSLPHENLLMPILQYNLLSSSSHQSTSSIKNHQPLEHSIIRPIPKRRVFCAQPSPTNPSSVQNQISTIDRSAWINETSVSNCIINAEPAELNTTEPKSSTDPNPVVKPSAPVTVIDKNLQQSSQMKNFVFHPKCHSHSFIEIVPADSNVVIDVACCDGPVRFQRIANENYNQNLCMDKVTNPENEMTALSSRPDEYHDETIATSSLHCLASNCDDKKQYFTNNEDKSDNSDNAYSTDSSMLAIDTSSMPDKPFNQFSNDTTWSSKSSNSSMHDSLLLSYSKNSNVSAMNGDGDKLTQSSLTLTAVESNIFKCVYCKHVFKSRYCYQKHKRRHINPIYEATACKVVNSFKPLDMNVPFYPCKTCGSKFPSYYFVHKHRKMCHSSKTSKTLKDRQPPCKDCPV